MKADIPTSPQFILRRLAASSCHRTSVIKKSARTGLFGVLVTLICAAVLSFGSTRLLAFFGPEAPSKVLRRALTFEERVGYQRKIEEVYWRHRIWPKESGASKPSLDAMMPRAELEKKVANYLRDSQALEQYWQQPTTGEQLQAELDRMATHTRQPEVLHELFAALDNDPFVVAECLARPTLTERMLRSAYAYDQRIHGQLRRRAESELLAHHTLEQMKQTSGAYSEIDLSSNDQAERHETIEPALKLEKSEWDEAIHKLATTFNKRTMPASGRAEIAATEDYESIPVGEVSPLQEDETGFYATAVTEKTERRLRVATVKWSKESIQSWRTRTETQLPAETPDLSAAYTLPAVTASSTGCANDSWEANSLNIPTPRDTHTAIWTGSEMIIWGGGFGSPSTVTNTGGRYNPTTDVWTTVNTVNAPSARGGHSAVWTGSEMIVWGGGWLNTGGRYNPSTDSWIATTTTKAPIGRSGHSAVWTGTLMIVWGGGNSTGELNTGGRYNPSTNSWTTTTTTNVPTARIWHSTVWTGSQMIVWGGSNNGTADLNTGGIYNPSTNSWTATSTTNAPSARENHTAVWTGSQMIIWGGINFSDPCNCGGYYTGGLFDPGTNTWTSTSTTNAPPGRYYHTAIWTGSEMIIWGGETFAGYVNAGSRYNPNTNSWTATTTTINAPPSRWRQTAVWTGSEMIVWGGDGTSSSGALNTGGRYNPSTNMWAPDQPPDGRIYHTVVWTGSEMVVWGGFNGYVALNTGGKYNPVTDTWVATNVAFAPSARYYHTAVWTGTEMIVWSGFDGNCSVNTGGRYDPGTDSWTSTSMVNAPAGRSYATTVWTGTEMIVWGGYDCDANIFNTGGKYNPSSDTWLATSIVNAPTPRSHHTAVWTGKEMVVWGGSPEAPFQTALNTGGKYNPNSDSWISTSMTNAPSARLAHATIWTGSEMIVWGGESDANYHQPGDNSYLLNTGARYSPATDTWTTTSITNAPSVRGGATGLWTGSEMVVWGGFDSGPVYALNTGGRYNPGTDSWTATTANNAPIGRSGQTAVWISSEMIVWGGLSGGFGYLNNGGTYCGQSSPPQLATVNSVVSRITHQNINVSFDVNLPLTGTRGVECRAGSSPGNYLLIFTFINNLSSVGSATVTSHNPTSGTGSVSSSAIGPNPDQYMVNITNVSNAQYLTVTLINVVDVEGNSGDVIGPEMGLLIGDTTANGRVNSADVSQAQSQTGQALSANNFREDITADGRINSADVSLVQSKSGTGLPTPP